ncbi:MAG: gluconeogenesis factor YvcK family protein [Actinomycetota bacterium]
MSDFKAVAIGGGTGLPIVLRALKGLTAEITAIVTMADDGGSSGKLREELGILPPGDVRNCLAALAADENTELVEMIQYRFTTGWSLAEHNLGNLIIAGMADYKGGFIEAIDALSRLLGVKGAVLPSTLENVRLYADVGGGSILAGQARIARTELIRHVHLEPKNAAAYEPAVEAIGSADLVIIGPGSLFTSLLPNLLIKGIKEEIAKTDALKVFILNTMNMRRETFGMTGTGYLEALERHNCAALIDTVLTHEGPALEDVSTPQGETAHPVEYDQDDFLKRDLTLVTADVADETYPLRHDPNKLRTALAGVVKPDNK